MSKIINILTAKLNYETANLIYNEYQERLRESNYLIDNYDYYKSLRERKASVETTLALSIFYKRLITNFEGFLSFTNTLHRNKINEMNVGSNLYQKKDMKRLYFLTKDFYDILQKFNISPLLFDYNDTKDFLKNLLEYRLK